MLLHASSVGGPGTQACGRPSIHRVTERRQAPTPQVTSPPGSGVFTHPDAGSQESAVQTFPSSQPKGEWTQLVTPQESTVQTFPSSHSRVCPLWQVPLLQISPAVQGLPSLQEPLTGS